jgi:hypothetical protein
MRNPAEIIDEMAADKEISQAIYALDSCYVQIYKNGNENYLPFYSNLWGSATLTEKDQEIYDSGIGSQELDVEMTMRSAEEEDRLKIVKRIFEGEDICFGENTEIGKIKEVIEFDWDSMKASVIVEYSNGEEKEAEIEIDRDLASFDVRS